MAEQGFTRPQYLVDTDWLAAHLDDADLRVFDCTTHLIPDPPRIYRVESGRADYDKAHIPNSGFIDLQAELSDNTQALRFMMPGPAPFAAAMSAKGVGEGTRVVLYARANIQWATRVWWMLRAMGFDDAMVLDGGFDKWQAEGRPVATAPVAYPAANFVARPRPGLFCDKAEVRAAIDDGAACVVNALRPDQHDGSAPLHYGRPGRIANSVNVPGVGLIDPASKAYRAAGELRRMFRQAGALERDRIVIYCGGGIAATNDAFVLTMLGHDNVTVYDASMSEWANDPAMPMATG